MLDDAPAALAGESNEHDRVGEAIDDEGPGIRRQGDLEEVVRAEDAIRPEDGRDHGEGQHPVMRGGVLPVEQPQQAGHLPIAPHDVGDPDARVEAGERRPDQGDQHGCGEDQGQDRAGAAQHRVADELDHVADRGP